jgi:predicted TIM-barrel fold metal-dependent hydrolase
MKPYIVDAHVHTGYPNVFYSPEVDAASLLRRMDQFGIQYAVNLCSMRGLLDTSLAALRAAQSDFESSDGRLFYCGFYDPRRAEDNLKVLGQACQAPGFKGIKIHPSLNKVPADDPRYDAVWRFAADHELPIVAHTWSVSTYNPVQVLSTPDKFEPFVRRYPQVRLVLGHSGGRGGGRLEAIRLGRSYPNVFLDSSGDIYCLGYFESLAREGLADRVLFGTDYPWVDLRSHLTRLYLADIPAPDKARILRDNALRVYRLEGGAS